jgi:hypothetical protein
MPTTSYPGAALDRGRRIMTDLERLTAAFHAMTPLARGMLVELAMGYVEDFPASTTLAAVDAAQCAQSGVDYCHPITNRSADNVEIDQS